MNTSEQSNKYDVVIVGGGVMGATLGVLLNELDPNLDIVIYERLDEVAKESSAAWNNAGTGHAAFCELNYTPEDEHGDVNINKALKIVQQFEESKQLWSYLVDKRYIDNPRSFINTCPHMSMVIGADNVRFLKKRYDKMVKSHLFSDMKYTTDFNELNTWMPLMMDGRTSEEAVAATCMNQGTDVNFGALTQKMISHLKKNTKVNVLTGHEVKSLSKRGKEWRVSIKNNHNQTQVVSADFVFLGAGGYALNLLANSGVKEGKGFGGFPVGGQWLMTRNPDLIKQHSSKVYTKPEVGAPPMSVPHLDLRIIDGEKALLFGPFAGFSTKFLKNGSWLDLFRSVRFSNIKSLLGAGINNIPLTKYLIEQVLLNKKQRVESLRKYYKGARDEDWEVSVAGQRVQIIKKDAQKGGRLQFGTEVVVDESKSLAALLGASPGASVSANAMVDLLERCFPEKVAGDWNAKLTEMIPSYGKSLADNPELTQEIREFTKQKLELNY